MVCYEFWFGKHTSFFAHECLKTHRLYYKEDSIFILLQKIALTLAILRDRDCRQEVTAFLPRWPDNYRAIDPTELSACLFPGITIPPT